MHFFNVHSQIKGVKNTIIRIIPFYIYRKSMTTSESTCSGIIE